MATSTNETISEVWEQMFLGKKRYGACGPRDILIIKSSESLLSPNIEPRKKGILTEEDKEKLKRGDIPMEYWNDEAKLFAAKMEKDHKLNVLPIEENAEASAKQVLDKIKSLFVTTRKPGVGISYFGPGKKITGDWCFRDGYITFQEIIELYNNFFVGKSLEIVSDCSYSGKWVQEAKNYLDNCKIKPCLHSARMCKTILSLVASCQAHEVPSTLFLATRGYFNDKNSGKIIINVPNHLSEDQNICYCSNALMICHADNLDSECLLPQNYTFKEQRIAETLFLVSNSSSWGLVIVVDDPEIIHRIHKNEVSAVDYGEIIKTGEGSMPDEATRKWIDCTYPGNYLGWSRM